jgi:hypothetical protein
MTFALSSACSFAVTCVIRVLDLYEHISVVPHSRNFKFWAVEQSILGRGRASRGLRMVRVSQQFVDSHLRGCSSLMIMMATSRATQSSQYSQLDPEFRNSVRYLVVVDWLLVAENSGVAAILAMAGSRVFVEV